MSIKLFSKTISSSALRLHTRHSALPRVLRPQLHLQQHTRPYRSTLQSPHHHYRLSSISFTALSAAALCTLATLLAWQAYSTEPQVLESTQESITADANQTPWVRIYPGMPSQLPPGRPGNLTKDQEAKLRELWESVMSICGTWPSTGGAAIDSDRASSTTNEDHDPKKKRGFGRLLGRGKKHEDEASDADDKHGQNKEFKEALASQSPEEIRDTMWSFTKADDPDAVLLRFLRARKWNVHDALVMMVATIHWRGKVVHLDDDIMKNGEGGALEVATTGSGQDKKNGNDFLTQLRMGKSFLHGEDKEGRPLCFVRVRLHKQGEQSETSLERYTVYTIETARLMLRPPVDTAVIVFDMTGFSMANMDYSPVKFMIKVFEANYPESLGAVLVHQAPWVFQGIWSVIKGWLDPVVASKVHFTKNAQDLSQFIEMKHVPKDLGGQEDWSYKYVEPVLGENEKMRDTETRRKVEGERERIVKEYEAATIKWVKTGEAAVQSTRLQLAERLRTNYWQLDPYVRARSLYDRWGVLKGGGVVDFHPSAAAAAPGKGAHGLAPSAAATPGHQSRLSSDQKSVYYDAQQDVD